MCHILVFMSLDRDWNFNLEENAHGGLFSNTWSDF